MNPVASEVIDLTGETPSSADVHVLNSEPSHASHKSKPCLDSPRNKPPLSGISSSVSHAFQPFVIELFAGSGRVTACLRHLGLVSSFGVDHVLQKNAGRVILCDLTTPEGQQLCLDWINSPLCLAVFAAPPCGTCSLARCIPLKVKGRRVSRGPPPLRSKFMPNGLMNLSFVNRLRVSQANKLYSFLTKVAIICLDSSKIIAIENPRRSLYWRTSFVKPLLRRMKFVSHQACAYSGQRPKFTSILHNNDEFNVICKTCPGESSSHVHLPWGLKDDNTFATKEEAAYPLPLAYEFAAAFARIAMTQGWNPPQDELAPQPSYAYFRAVSAVQPKASKLPPLISEFSHTKKVAVAAGTIPPCEPGQSLKHDWHGIPAHSRLLKRTPLRSTVGNEEKHYGSCMLVFGVFRSPEQFVCTATNTKHPVLRDTCLPKPLHEAIMKHVAMGAKEISQYRVDTLREWAHMAAHLQASEKALHKSFPDHVAKILRPKRILLFKELLKRVEYPDLDVVDEICNGVHLTGRAPYVDSFDNNFKPATKSVHELQKGAPAANKVILYSVRSSGDDFIDAEVFRKTKEELMEGWISGPLKLEDLPTGSVINRRFGR